jgi:hypothetical protein
MTGQGLESARVTFTEPRAAVIALRAPRPLLSGREVDDVLGSLSRSFLARRSPLANPSLAAGEAGLALVHAAFHAAFPGEGHDARAERSLERAGRMLASLPTTPSLFSGFVGVAWVTELLNGDPAASPEDDPSSGIDEALERHLDPQPWTHPYDAVDGLVGFGIYALERLPRPSARRLLAQIVSRLDETAWPQSPGISWLSDPAWVPAALRKPHHGAWNLGAAHGVPGVVALLGRIASSAVDPPTAAKARALLGGAVAWILAQELPPGSGGGFPAAVGPGITRAPARIGWCYGDVGIAATLLVAARAVREPTWEETAVRIALSAARRIDAAGALDDTGLCHGAAGVAHALHRMAMTTGDERLAEAARTWFARLLTLRRPRGAFAGFSVLIPLEGGAFGRRAEPGFLKGAGGVALALLAAAGRAVPSWDRALLLS